MLLSGSVTWAELFQWIMILYSFQVQLVASTAIVPFWCSEVCTCNKSLWQHRDLWEHFLIHLYKFTTSIKGCLVLQFTSDTTCKCLLSFRIWHVHRGILCNRRDLVGPKIHRTIGEMLNMEAYFYLLVHCLQPQMCSVHLCIEIRVAVLYASWMYPILGQSPCPSYTVMAISSKQEKQTHIQQSWYIEERNSSWPRIIMNRRDRIDIFREASGTGHPIPLKTG